ncbi:hypothetical protein GPA19_05445 [Azoarcus indigens]|uniref:hypothetical protein n=1 Tax=Azoarcus indigens TaxID=29545 RepID=UPI00105C8C9C|nr:hypothetical protein [Azoarcus indigens]NMG64390.1 hypothetical protein [Azoarcus indigens]
MENEIVGYVMACHARIEQPPGGIIQLPGALLQGIGIPCEAPSAYCFVSMSCIDLNSRRQGSLFALLGDNLEALQGILQEWPGFPQLVAFDSWLANVDRNTGNLILTGNAHLIPIDHSDILTGPEWTHNDLVTMEEKWSFNKLLELIFPAESLPLPIRSAILKSAERFNAAYSLARRDLYRWLGSGDPDYLRAHHFIWGRAETTKSNLAAYFNMIL